MTNNEELVQQAKVEQEKYKAEQEKYKKEQEESKSNQEKLILKKRELELASLRWRYKRAKCFIFILSVLIFFFSGALIYGGFRVFCSISKEVSDPAYNWIRLVFGSMMMTSFVVLIIVLGLLIKKLLYQTDEE